MWAEKLFTCLDVPLVITWILAIWNQASSDVNVVTIPLVVKPYLDVIDDNKVDDFGVTKVSMHHLHHWVHTSPIMMSLPSMGLCPIRPLNPLQVALNSLQSPPLLTRESFGILTFVSGLSLACLLLLFVSSCFSIPRGSSPLVEQLLHVPIKDSIQFYSE